MPPAAKFSLGAWAESIGTALVLVVLGAIVVLLPVHHPRTLAESLGVWGAFGAILFPWGELLQWSAKKDLEDAGEPVPEAWQRDRGTIELLDRYIGEWARTPVREVLGL